MNYPLKIRRLSYKGYKQPKMNCKKAEKCRICSSKNLKKFIDFGRQPLPNGFLKPSDLNKKEKVFKLGCCLCQNCGLVQLSHIVSPSLMFSDYVYIPSGAKIMMNNFSNLFYYTHKKLNFGKDSFVIDIGSNDGSLLTFFKKTGSKVLGIDPAKNLKKTAQKRGIPTKTALFNTKTALQILKNYGKADLITATNVIAHIDNLREVMAGVKMLLKDKGLFVTEFPYLLDLVNKNQFDTIYHEHLSYFSISPWNKLIAGSGLKITAALRLQIHGGSIRLVHKLGTSTSTSKQLDFLISLERANKLHDLATLEKFSDKVTCLKTRLRKTLDDIKGNGKKIAGLGAAAKGNILTNFFGIGRETLEYIADSTPLKQGLYTPGKHIPIVPESMLLKNRPDFALVLAWNFSDEIIKKYEWFRKSGGRFIIPIPEVKII